MTALLVVLFAAAAQAQAAPAARPQAQTDHATAAATRAERAKAAIHHRVILLRVDEVLAADTGEGIDMRLLPMGGRLESLFRYTTYRLISRQIGRTECGRTAAFTLPGGWIVHVAPSAVRDNMIAMELMLFNGAHPMMTTDVRMRNHGMLIIGGPHYRQGMLIIPIGADAPELATPSGPIAVTPEGTMPEATESRDGRAWRGRTRGQGLPTWRPSTRALPTRALPRRLPAQRPESVKRDWG